MFAPGRCCLWSGLRNRVVTGALAPSTRSLNDDATINRAKKMLLQYEGGKIDLSKDDQSGIAKICLNHPKKRNALSGKALGGGAEFTISPDFRLFGPKGELCFVQAKMGVATGWAGGTMLVRKFGPQLALDLLLTGRKITPEEAVSLGIASDIVDSFDDAEEWLKKRVAIPTEVLRTVKAIVHCASVTDCHHALTYEKELFSLLWGGTAQKEALAGNLKHT
ncbi:unnamed protein product [Darwinula stevensoni]|uniref:Enoyl-CoA hydratase n=1 Tax=Darwinula stevensoni TaxID=69355 RepID=A0A7R8X8W9_9CRUS|nr:unnamed protein product [Darwinula stevensoni]CAG0883856.1 unnamed protein product [Darwinula stevensoni]